MITLQKQLDKIKELEIKNIDILNELSVIRNDKQSISSKESDLMNKQTYLSKELQEAYTLLKELIIKGSK